MNQQPVEKFKEIKSLFKRLSDEMCLIVESYYIWRTLTFAVSILEVGEEKANRNVQIISRYADFFVATRHSHFQTFVLGLYKFFDTTGGTLSVRKLIEEIDKYQYAFKPEVVRLALPQLGEHGLIPDDYTPIDAATLAKIAFLEAEQNRIRGTLENIRHGVAHAVLDKKQDVFIPAEVEYFISVVQEIFNTLSGKFDLSSTHWGHLQDGAIYATNYLLDDLERGEQKRMEEWGIK